MAEENIDEYLAVPKTFATRTGHFALRVTGDSMTDAGILERDVVVVKQQSSAEEGDIVAVRYTERGTSVGPFRGQEPTGKSYEIVAMEWFEMKEGLIHRRWGARDSGAQQRQMGLAPL